MKQIYVWNVYTEMSFYRYPKDATLYNIIVT